MSKKIASILSLAALCMGFVACDEVEESLSKPQENPQEPVMTVNGIETAVPAATATVVSLPAYANENREGLVPVLDVTKLENFPENSVLAGVMQLSATEDFAKYYSIDLKSEGEEGSTAKVMVAPVEAWEDAHIAMFTKNPRPADTYMRIYLYAVNGTEKVALMNGESLVFNTREVEVTPLDAVMPVEQKYYLVTDAETIEMTATNPENVYDPPTFTAIFTAPAKFTVKGESGKVYGMGDAEGTLVADGKQIEETVAGPHMLTINMEKLTYKVSLAIENLYVYASAPESGYTLTTGDYINYKGFAGFRGSAPSFRLAGEKNNATHLLWGIGLDAEGNPVLGTLESSETPTPVPLEGPGCYFITVNMGGLTYNVEHITSFGLIGGFNGWGSDVVMTPTDKYNMVWTAELEITNGTEFKIRTNGDWDGADIGAGEDPQDLNALVEHGGNMQWALGDGTFTVTLDLNNVPYTLTAVKK